PGVDAAWALLAYAGPARRLVSGLKYRNNRASLVWLATGITQVVGEPPDVVTWAPTSAARARRRGFDQAELLAAAVARRLHRPARRLLTRRAGAGPQTGRTRAERLAGPAFDAVGPVSGVVLVVDDVLTTGASLAAAAAALRAAGSRRVLAAVAAHPSAARTAPRSRVLPPAATAVLLP
ncbi:MAG: hypothetical protein GEV08_21335, partial [Acidimicrobiia bacterium]|nr:hypothetical protein [Acidimicrobiia bacterium]